MQVIGYDRLESALLLAHGGEVEREPLDPGRTLRYTLGERRCAGTVDGDDHHGCDRPAAPYCETHTSTWVCARCTGTCLKDEMDCHQPHAVYLAAFAPDTFKVGVTRQERLEDRLREQGADRGAHLRTVPDGRLAREIESEIATEIGDRVRVPTKMAGLHCDVDVTAWQALLTEYEVLETFSFDYGLVLTDRPVQEILATGTVRGTKGRILVLDRPGGTYAVDLRDLVGHVLHEGATDRDLQTSLGSFG